MLKRIKTTNQMHYVVASSFLLIVWFCSFSQENLVYWKYSTKVTVNAGSVGLNGNVTNFPLLVRLQGSNFDFAKARGNGYDIRFTNASGTKLPFERERYDSTARVAEFWVLADNIPQNGSTNLIMYFGKSNAPDSSKATDVFKASGNFAAVWHLNENPAGGAASIKDRTNNGNHGTPGGSMPITDTATGMIGRALDFDSVDNDRIDVGSQSCLDDLNQVTVSAWIRPKGWGGSGSSRYGRIINKIDTVSFKGLSFSTSNTNATFGLNTFAFMRDRATDTTDARAANNTLTLNQWAYVTVVMDGETSTKLYYNGSEIGYLKQQKGSGALISDAAYNMYIGNGIMNAGAGFNRPFNGIIDELTISNTIRSPDWIKLSYRTQINSQTVVTVNQPEQAMITTHPQSTAVNIGNPASFTVAASGIPTPLYQWQKKQGAGAWADISGATGTTLSASSVQYTDSGSYRAIASNTGGSDTSRVAVLTVSVIVPTITTHPQSATVNYGSAATLTAAASGSPVITWQWEKKQGSGAWVAISGATATTYSIPAMAFSDTGSYHAIATNAGGSATSNAAVLKIGVSAPTITTHPQSATFNLGGTTTFTVAASGTPTITWQWEKKQGSGAWTAISGATGATYSIPAAAFSDTGSYHAVATNMAGSATSNTAVLTMGNYPPTITTHPRSDTAILNTPVQFTVAASGSPAPVFNWFKNGVLLVNTGATLSIASVKLTDAGAYKAVASNSMGADTSDTAVLMVFDTSNSISSQPLNDTVLAGQQALFYIKTTGTGVTYQWQKLVGSTPSNISAATDDTLAFTALATDSGTSYRCITAAGPAFDTSRYALLTIATVPVLTSVFPSDTAVATGANMTITAAATGKPVPQISWYLYYTPTSDTVFISTGASLLLPAITKQNNAFYFAKAGNGFGFAYSNPVYLHVLDPVSITTNIPQKQYVIHGGAVQLSIAASGDGTMQYQWYQNGTVINGQTANSFTINPVDSTIHNKKVYSCRVTNYFSTIAVSAELSHTCTLSVSRYYNPFKVRVDTIPGNAVLVNVKMWSDVEISKFPSVVNPVTQEPWCDSLLLFYNAGSFPTDTAQSKIVRYSTEQIKIAVDTLIKTLTVGQCPAGIDTLSFSYTLLWHDPKSVIKDTLLKPFSEANSVKMPSPPNRLVVHGQYKMLTDTALLIIDSIPTLSILTDSAVVLQLSNQPLFDPVIFNTSLSVAPLLAGGPSHTVIVDSIGKLPLDTLTLYCRWYILGKSNCVSVTKDTSFTIGWLRPEYKGTLTADSTLYGGQLSLRWDEHDKPVDSIKVWWDTDTLPLDFSFSLSETDHAKMIKPATLLSDTLKSLENNRIYCVGVQIYRDMMWSRLTTKSRVWAKTSLGDTSTTINIIKIDTSYFMDSTNTIMVQWHINSLDAPGGRTYEAGYTYNVDSLKAVDTATVNPVKAWTAVSKKINTTSIPLGDGIVFDTTYTVGLWLRGVSVMLGPGMKSAPADSSVAKVTIPPFTWQKLTFFNTKDTVYAVNGKVAIVKIQNQDFTITENLISYTPGTLPEGFCEAGGVCFKFEKQLQVPSFLLGLRYDCLPAGADTDKPAMYQYVDGRLKIIYGSFVSGGMVWAVVKVQNTLYPFRILADTQKPTITVEQYNDTVNADEDILYSFGIADNIANGQYRFMYGSGDTGYIYTSADTLQTCTTSAIQGVIEGSTGTVVNASFGLRCQIIATDGINSDTVNVSRCVRSVNESFGVSKKRWLPLRTSRGLNEPQLEKIFTRSTETGQPWQYDIYNYRLYRWCTEQGSTLNDWLEYDEAVKDSFNLVPGRLIWCKTAQDMTVRFDAGVTTSLKVPYTIVLKPQNWTDITMPFQFPVRLRDILDETGGYKDLEIYHWVQVDDYFEATPVFIGEMDDATEVTDTLTGVNPKYDAYTVYNNRSMPVVLKIPPTCPALSKYSQTKYRDAGKPAVEKTNTSPWYVSLLWKQQGSNSGSLYRSVSCGYNKEIEATGRYGCLPPSMSALHVGIVNPRSAELSGWALQQSLDKGGIFFEVCINNTSEKKTTIDYYLDDRGVLPKGFSAMILNPQTGRYDNCSERKPAQISVNSCSSERRVVVIGTQVFQENMIVAYLPLKFVKAFPNPFKGMIKLMYRLPAGINEVQFSLFNLRGQMLWQGIQRNSLEPGEHIYYLNANENTTLSAGLYLMRLTARNKAGKEIFGGKKRIVCVR